MTEPLDHKCPICGSGPGQDCRNTITPGRKLPGRTSHFARTDYPFCVRCGIPHKPPCLRPEGK